eukprot:TRINITY_DN31182_c0_g1_i1.p1 TRINITY_DN31182_c0_g1~~TRINITY_DN31182_c0_g1_i1.p1  ORF type:complete len:168 (+),score=29.57 TRINITY_DN31182_c0_g1_i1:467-970(+)
MEPSRPRVIVIGSGIVPAVVCKVLGEGAEIVHIAECPTSCIGPNKAVLNHERSSYDVKGFFVTEVNLINLDTMTVHTDRFGDFSGSDIVLCPSSRVMDSGMTRCPMVVEVFPEMMDQKAFVDEVDYLLKIARARSAKIKRCVAEEQRRREEQLRHQQQQQKSRFCSQ